MIQGNYKNINTISFFESHPDIKTFIKNHSLEKLDSGSYKINNDDYVNVEIYDTKPLTNICYENHKQYIDVQYMIEGSERIFLHDKKELSVVESYNQEKDIEFFENNGEKHSIVLQKNDFVVIFPEEAHAPCMMNQNIQSVKKAVFKIRIK